MALLSIVSAKVSPVSTTSTVGAVTICAGVLLLLMLAAATRSAAQGMIAEEQESLRDVDSFQVRIDVEAGVNLASGAHLDVARIRAAAIDTLRAAGLPVLSAERTDGPALPYLYVHVNALDYDGRSVPFSLDVCFYQPVRLPRGNRLVDGCTWNTGLVGLTFINQMDVILDTVTRLMTEFINDYLEVNSVTLQAGDG